MGWQVSAPVKAETGEPDPTTVSLSSYGHLQGHRHAGFCGTCGGSVYRHYVATAEYLNEWGGFGASLPGEGGGVRRVGPWRLVRESCGRLSCKVVRS